MITLGQKIRMLRKEKNLTQAALCGDFMTRNMLSQIESDSAGPSVATIRYLADRLGVPAGYLLDDGDNLLPYRKITEIEGIRRLYREKQWQKCLDACKNLVDFDDELALIMADCYLHLGIDAYDMGQIEGARRWLSLAEVFAGRTVYPHEEIERLSAVYLAIIESAATEAPPVQISDYAGESFVGIYELALYHQLLRIIEQSRYEAAAQLYDAVNLKNPLYRTHISAKLSESAGNFERSAELLRNLIDRFDDESASLAFRLRIYTDMEVLCRNHGDYKGAYEAGQLRQQCLERFRTSVGVRTNPNF